jgi:5'-nucleotidase (lipoprotein e(P4) family)
MFHCDFQPGDQLTVPRATRIVSLIATLLVTACASHPRPTLVPQPMSSTTGGRKDIRWFRSSAEYRGIALEVYRTAGDHLAENARGLATGTWAVILDADETILDNSRHERQLADRNESFTETEWALWVRQRAATAVPGAVEFTRKVHALGGRVAIVTNRADSLCTATRDNLRSVGVDADVVLCQLVGQSDKNPRFEKVENGTAATGVPALKVVEWLGDNIQDFPGLTQAVRTVSGAYAEFGRRYFLLPNPMYGSWEKNPEP